MQVAELPIGMFHRQPASSPWSVAPAPLREPRADPCPANGAVSLLRQVLDAISHGLVLVDHEGRLVHANLAARAGAGRGDPIETWTDRMGLGRSDAAALAAALVDARRGRWSMVMAQRRGQALSIGVAPLQGDASFPDVAAMLLITCPASTASLPLQFFCQQHRLTPTEALVLGALHEGQSPDQIAQAGRIAMTTVRTHIATIRAKVRAPSIRHLLRMLAALPPLMGARTRMPL